MKQVIVVQDARGNILAVFGPFNSGRDASIYGHTVLDVNEPNTWTTFDLQEAQP